MSTYGKVVPYVRGEVLRRRLPHGLISWRYLWPGRNQSIRQHRHFWWHTPTRLPRPLWLLLQLWLYARWLGWYGWLAGWRSVRQHGAAVRAETGMSPLRQLLRVLRLALGRCMPPRMIYHYRLYLPDSQPWAYVADNETTAFHRWRDGLSAPRGVPTLADKWLCSQRLTAIGVPVAQTLLLLPRTATEPDWQTFTGPLFLKPRAGSAGRHCFYLDPGQDYPHWRQYGPVPSAGLEAQRHWRQARAKHDYLVQPCYRNALPLRHLAEEAITLRVLSTRTGDGISVELAWLEIPSAHGRHDIRPLDPASGMLLNEGPLSPPNELCWEATAQGGLPHWQQATTSAIRAHHELAGDLYSVAWDFVLTDEGALLLEGNASWNTGPLQVLRGGLLANLIA